MAPQIVRYSMATALKPAGRVARQPLPGRIRQGGDSGIPIAIALREQLVPHRRRLP